MRAEISKPHSKKCEIHEDLQFSKEQKMRGLKNGKLTAISKTLRKNMTDDEKHLWYDFLKGLPITVNRQKVIGPYVLDFYCASKGIAIELDGSQHNLSNESEKDYVRDEYLKKRNIVVLRYSNKAVRNNFRDVCADILEHLIPENKMKS